MFRTSQKLTRSARKKEMRIKSLFRYLILNKEASVCGARTRIVSTRAVSSIERQTEIARHQSVQSETDNTNSAQYKITNDCK